MGAVAKGLFRRLATGAPKIGFARLYLDGDRRFLWRDRVRHQVTSNGFLGDHHRFQSFHKAPDAYVGDQRDMRAYATQNSGYRGCVFCSA